MHHYDPALMAGQCGVDELSREDRVILRQDKNDEFELAALSLFASVN